MKLNAPVLSHKKHLLRDCFLAALFCLAVPGSAQQAAPTAAKPQASSVLTAPSHAGLPHEDADTRQEIARQLQADGVTLDWRKYDLLGLIEIESRVASARQLKAMGVAVDWHKYDSDKLLDMEMRVSVAQRLKGMGIRADWSKYSLQTLLDMETYVEAAERLKQNGAAVEKLTVSKPGSEATSAYRAAALRLPTSP